VTSPGLQWLTIEDFSPGIWNRTNFQGGGLTRAPLGAATEANTFRCGPLPGGGLGPMARKIRSFDIGTLPSDGGSGSLYRLTGFLVDRITGTFTPSSDLAEFHVGIEWIFDTGGGSLERRWEWRRVKEFLDTGGFDTITTFTGATHSGGTAAFSSGFSSFFYQRFTPDGDVGTPGVPCIVGAWTGERNFTDNYAAVFPDPGDLTSGVTTVEIYNAAADRDIWFALGHQNRAVFFLNRLYERTATGQNVGAFHNATWTAANDTAVTDPTENAWFPETPGGVADAASMSAGELFLVSTQDGALTLNGDLDNPTVFNLPNVQPATGNRIRGCHSTVGYLYYGSDIGCWAWNGGDTSVNVSRQLDPDFMDRPSSSNQNTFFGTSQRWMDYSIWPQNWAFHQDTQSWWRLDETDNADTVYCSQLPIRESLYLCEAQSTEGEEVIHRYDWSAPAFSWSWESHPIYAVTTNRVFNVREVVLVMQGADQDITVTLTGLGGTTATKTFNLDSASSPVEIRFPLPLRCRNLQVWIEADGSANSNPAAVLYEARIGWSERMHIPNE